MAYFDWLPDPEHPLLPKILLSVEEIQVILLEDPRSDVAEALD